MSSPKKAVPPKFSGLLKQGIIEAAPASAVSGMPVFATLPAPASPPADGGQADAVTLVPLELIDTSRFQNRLALNPERVASLAENIRQDGLHSPITVRPSGGRYELVAGETRMLAYRHLGLDEIPAFVREMDDAQSARSTVLDNFFHESLTDYEIFKGLQTLMATNAAASVRGLAEITPWEKSHVQRLLAFDRLPPAAADMLERQPGLIGCATAEALAVCLTRGVDAALLVNAVERVRDGKLPQTRAAAWALAKHQGKTPANPGAIRAVVTSPQGTPLCTVDRNAKGIKIQAAPGVDIDWEPIQATLIGLLQGRLAAPDSDAGGQP